MHNAKLSRRSLLQWAGAVPAAPWVSGVSAVSLLGACSDNNTSAPAVAGTVTGITFATMAAPTTTADRATTFTNATITVAYSNGTTASKPLAYKAIYKTGDVMNRPDGGTAIAGGYYDINGNIIIDTSATTAVPFYSDCPDGTSLLKLANPTITGVSGNVLFHVAQFEYKTASAAQGEARAKDGVGNLISVNGGQSMYGLLPSQIGVTTVSQNKSTGELTPVYYHPVNTASVHGLWITCASSLSPWNTHLSSEEYPPDAAALTGSALTSFQTFSTNLFGGPTLANPYHYGHVPEVTVKPDGTATIKKHFCLGRLSREKVQVMPDNKTVIMGDDATSGGMFMFVADVAGDLSSGSLYAAQLTETDNTKRAVGGAYSIAFIKLGHASSSQIEALANQLFASYGQTGAWQGIFESVFKDFKTSADAPNGYTTAVTTANLATIYITAAAATAAALAGYDYSTYKLINFSSAQQLVKVKAGAEIAAAFLESERYASYLGATMEFTKLEGVALNIKDKKAYLAMSAIKSTMTNNASYLPASNNVLQLTAINAGATYEVPLGTDALIGSDWVPKSMSVPTKLLGKDQAADSNGNTADVDTIANVDNLWFSEATRTLFLGEDSGMHVNNFVWAYNVDTNTLSRIFSAPAGAECTGLQAVDNLNGYSYVMSNFQHPGDWESIHNTLLNAAGSTLNAAINANWSNKDKAALGYIVLPAVGT